MSEDKALLISLVQQFYEDISRLVGKDPSLVLEDPAIQLYNALLVSARTEDPECEFLLAFRPWEARNIRAKDALISVGQLATYLSHTSE